MIEYEILLNGGNTALLIYLVIRQANDHRMLTELVENNEEVDYRSPAILDYLKGNGHASAS